LHRPTGDKNAPSLTATHVRSAPIKEACWQAATLSLSLSLSLWPTRKTARSLRWHRQRTRGPRGAVARRARQADGERRRSACCRALPRSSRCRALRRAVCRWQTSACCATRRSRSDERGASIAAAAASSAVRQSSARAARSISARSWECKARACELCASTPCKRSTPASLTDRLARQEQERCLRPDLLDHMSARDLTLPALERRGMARDGLWLANSTARRRRARRRR
jgi:hypothetical protein